MAENCWKIAGKFIKIDCNFAKLSKNLLKLSEGLSKIDPCQIKITRNHKFD